MPRQLRAASTCPWLSVWRCNASDRMRRLHVRRSVFIVKLNTIRDALIQYVLFHTMEVTNFLISLMNRRKYKHWCGASVTMILLLPMYQLGHPKRCYLCHNRILIFVG